MATNDLITTPKLKNSTRLSSNSSRQGSGDSLAKYSPNIDLSHLKSLFDRQKRHSTLVPVPPRAPIVYDSQNHRNSGFDVSFVLPPSSNLRKSETGQQKRLSLRGLPRVDDQAVYYSLLQKNKSFSNILKKARSEAEAVGSEQTINSSTINEDRTVTYTGNIIGMEKPKIEICAAVPLDAISTMAVNHSDVVVNFSDITGWPWFKETDYARFLYGSMDGPSFDLIALSRQLPRIKCPSLTHTLSRYLESVETFVASKQYQKTKDIVITFAGKEGKCLQKRLMQYDSTEENWIRHALPNHSYCYSLEEAPLVNLGIIAPFCHDVWPEKHNSLLGRATIMITIVTEFWNLIRAEKLKPVKDTNGDMIDMQQFLELFSSVTLPGIPSSTKHKLMKRVSEGPTPRHIIVAYKGFLFVMNVADANYSPLSPILIANSLQGIRKFVDTGVSPLQEGINVLTSNAVPAWSEANSRLLHYKNNTESFREIEHALYIISLDHLNVNGLDQLVNEALFGEGCNRWYDKGLNFYIHNNGFVTISLNSKMIDGSTVAFLLHYMHVRIQEESRVWNDEIGIMDEQFNEEPGLNITLAHLVKADRHADLPEPLQEDMFTNEALKITDLKLLDFSMDEKTQAEVFKTTRLFSALSKAVQTSVCKIDSFRKDFFDITSINKDAFAHLSIHLAYFRMHFRLASVGCRVSIKKFLGMRYDILRSSTKEIAEWCRAFLDESIDKAIKDELLWKAHDKHVELLLECHNGRGYDNHLNALRNILGDDEILDESNPFADESFFQSGGGDRCEIFTETLGVGCTSCPVLLPCVPSGYGVGYSVADSFLMFTITSWEEEKESSAVLMASVLKQACNELISCASPRLTRAPKSKITKTKM